MLNQRKYLFLALSDFFVVAAILFALFVLYCGMDIRILFSEKGVSMLKYYTVDANFLAGASCLICLPFEIYAAGRPGRRVPRWAGLLKFTGAVCLTLTFLVVVFFLWPMFGLKKVTEGADLFMHFVIPVWFVAVYCLSGEGASLSRRHLPAALIPTVLYGGIYLLRLLSMEEVTFGASGDWYGFARWGRLILIPLFFLLLAVLYGIAFLLWRLAGGTPGRRKGRH